MRCPRCGHLEDKVVDSRSSKDGAVIRRRRECLSCGHRFTTYEQTVRSALRVIKRDSRREAFDRGKLAAGIEKACEKRDISAERIEQVVDEIIGELQNEYEREVDSKVIGEKVMERLQGLDEVAYVRFASVYRQFKDVNQFVKEIQSLIDHS